MKKNFAVLCVHGIQGSPAQFEWIIAALPRQMDVYNILLPGHGADVRAFRKSGMMQWQAYVDQTLNELAEKYENIFYIGHSMGCLLGIDACIRKKGNIAALYLLACPLALRPTFRYIKNNLCAVAGWKLDDPFVSAARTGNSVRAKSPLAYLTCIRPYWHLLLKIRRVRKQLSALHAPVFAIHSAEDEIVSPSSLRFFNPLPNAQTRIVPDSGHYLYSKKARQTILQDILENMPADI